MSTRKAFLRDGGTIHEYLVAEDDLIQAKVAEKLLALGEELLHVQGGRYDQLVCVSKGISTSIQRLKALGISFDTVHLRR